MKRGIGKRRGSATIELVITWPVLSLLFFGVLDYARLMNSYSSLNNAARAAVQKAINDTPTYALAAGAADPSSWNAVVTQMQTAASQNITETGVTTEVTKTFACPSGNGGETAHQTTVPTCSNYRIYIRTVTSLPVSPWVPFARIVFPSAVTAAAVVRVK